MARKLKLSLLRKNYCRKRKPICMKVPRSKVMVFPVVIPLDSVKLPQTFHVSSLEQLRSALTGSAAVPNSWSLVDSDSAKIVLASVSAQPDGTSAAVSFCLMIFEDLSWSLSFRNKPISHEALSNFSRQLTSVSSVVSILHFLDSDAPSLICAGNDDEKFQSLPQFSKGVFLDMKGNQIAYVEQGTIRHVSCELLLSQDQDATSTRCKVCTTYRNTLRAIASRHTKNVSTSEVRTAATNPHSRINNRWRTSSELSNKMSCLAAELRSEKAKVQILTAKLEEASHQDGVSVDRATHSDLVAIMKENAENMASSYPDNSFPRLFWEQQLKAATQKKAKSMRWHPMMVRWCLYLRHVAGKGYEILRKSGCLNLPSPRTLRDYTYHNPTTIGFSAATDGELLNILQAKGLTEEWQKVVVLLMDEVYIREEVVYHKHTGKILGLVNLGDINNHLLRLERVLDGSKAPSVAKTMLMLMVRGLCTSLTYPYAQFACRALTAEQMYTPVTEAIYRLERLGLKVLGVTADGARSNRLLASLLDPSGSKDGITYKVPNPYCDEERPIFFFSDPPHLIKTIRNCVSNKRRHLWCKGMEIKWEHIEQLYFNDSGAQRSTPGLSIVPKLKYEHLHLDSFAKMRVDLAAQVMSESVAKGLLQVVGSEAEGTAEMIMLVDKMFDCLNVTNCSEGIRKRKPSKDPYTHASDWRLKWLEGEFLEYLKEWEESVTARQDVSKEEKKRMMLSKETRNGIEMTVRAFVELVRFLFTIPGVRYFLSERICQDPLENFFGCQRQRGRVNENPSVSEFVKNTQALRVCGNLPAEVKGNCRGSVKKALTFNEKENTAPLPKRRRKHN